MMALLAVAGCTDDCGSDGCGPGTLRVSVPGPTRFQLYAAVDASTVVRADCGGPGPTDAGAGCEVAGVVLAAHPPSLWVTVKSPGYRTASTVLSPAWTAASGCDACGLEAHSAEVPIALDTLPAPEVTADYRTGFDEAGGLDAFKAMAYASSDELGPVYAVKFFIEGLEATPTVYFQDTKKHPIHYDFVHTVLGRPGSLSAFEKATYVDLDRKQMAGTVLWRPDLAAPSAILGAKTEGAFTVEFFPSDTLTPALARTAYLRLQERMPFSPLSGGERALFYLPPGSQQEAAAHAAAHDLAAAGVLWFRRDELYGGLTTQLLNPGVAFGTLRVLTPDELNQSAVSFHDVLVLTRLPNEMPIVGGSITMELQTPLAHVNVAARARGTPNMSLLGAATDPAIAPLVGQLVRFEVGNGTWSIAAATFAEAQAFWDAHAGKPQQLPKADLTDTGFLDFEDAGFADSVRIGVKAANVAELSHVLGDRAPHGFAVPFHDYDAFITTAQVTVAACDGARADCAAEAQVPASTCDQARARCLPAGAEAETLADHLARLVADPALQTDSALRFAALDAARHHFCAAAADPAYGLALDAKVQAVLGNQGVRLRSSTNAEDLPSFSGAGLYNSYGAAVGTDKPPSARICKVWASVWSWRGYEERAFWNIDHLAVKMGVAVHQSFPDEQANGVIITQNIADPFTRGMYVNVQKGEVSVTNPTEGAVPEIFSILQAPKGVQVARQRYSSLSPDAPLLTDAEVGALYTAAFQAHEHFAPLYGKVSDLVAFDIEFKFHGPERKLFFKQLRPYVVGGE